ncbi:MAG TPA: hypothetical protein VJ453_06790 [Terriglobales bacterium]|jgi:hypothetical protein|nr:hypothetical protein [Terriglobales bacterium]
MTMQIHWGEWLFWGFVASLALVATESIAQGLGLTRLNLPLILGTALTPDRDRARALGILLHVIMGWLFSLFYVVAMQFLGGATWYHGAIIGVAHALVICVIGWQALPGVHPRMASETHGPTATRMLEPPGFMGLNYGVSTPATVFMTHAIFGAILGGFYS